MDARCARAIRFTRIGNRPWTFPPLQALLGGVTGLSDEVLAAIPTAWPRLTTLELSLGSSGGATPHAVATLLTACASLAAVRLLDCRFDAGGWVAVLRAVAHGRAESHLRDVAAVRIGGDFRRGALDVNGRSVVGGIVVMRYGENAWQVIQAVKARLADLTPGLPAGVKVVSFYDRSDLIGRAIDTLKHALTEEVILVTLAHILFLFHFRSILIVTLPLPASILISFILMDRFGIPSHIMSLTGIAISIGVLVDAGIVGIS